MTRWAHYALLCGFPQACKEKHVAVEGFMVYCVVWEGVTECSNTLEDEEDTELLPQALVYKPCRQLIYGLLLLQGHDGRTANLLETSHEHHKHTCTDTHALWKHQISKGPDTKIKKRKKNALEHNLLSGDLSIVC